MGVERSELIMRMRSAVTAGVKVGRFIAKEKAAGRYVGRRTTYLADYRSVSGLKAKEGLARFIRKDRYPTEKTMASVEWALGKEYMYKVKVQSVIKVGEPITDRFVNIMSDVPMTIGEIEVEVEQSWGEWERYKAEKITGLQVWSAVHKVMP